MASPSDEILNLLRDYQKRHRLTDEQMAERLGVAASSWNLFRRDKRPLPKAGILGGFARLFPRRTRLLGDYLGGGSSDAEYPEGEKENERR